MDIVGGALVWPAFKWLLRAIKGFCGAFKDATGSIQRSLSDFGIILQLAHAIPKGAIETLPENMTQRLERIIRSLMKGINDVDRCADGRPIGFEHLLDKDSFGSRVYWMGLGRKMCKSIMQKFSESRRELCELLPIIICHQNDRLYRRNRLISARIKALQHQGNYLRRQNDHLRLQNRGISSQLIALRRQGNSNHKHTIKVVEAIHEKLSDSCNIGPINPAIPTKETEELASTSKCLPLEGSKQQESIKNAAAIKKKTKKLQLVAIGQRRNQHVPVETKSNSVEDQGEPANLSSTVPEDLPNLASLGPTEHHGSRQPAYRLTDHAMQANSDGTSQQTCTPAKPQVQEAHNQLTSGENADYSSIALAAAMARKSGKRESKPAVRDFSKGFLTTSGTATVTMASVSDELDCQFLELLSSLPKATIFPVEVHTLEPPAHASLADLLLSHTYQQFSARIEMKKETKPEKELLARSWSITAQPPPTPPPTPKP